MGLIQFIRNLKYLCKYNIKALSKEMSWVSGRVWEHNQHWDAHAMRTVLAYLDFLNSLYKHQEVGAYGKPIIKTREETMQELAAGTRSLVRYGDGEISLILGDDIAFQKGHEQLRHRLIEIVQSGDERVMVGICRSWWYLRERAQSSAGAFNRWDTVDAPYFRFALQPHLKQGKTYYSADVSMAYMNHASDCSPGEWYDMWRAIWEGREVVVICGDRVFSKVTHNIFDNAKSVEYLYVPTVDAFAVYDDILARAKEIQPGKLICIIAGPTATVLAYDLTVQCGFRALDVGHLAQDYDHFKCGDPRDMKAVEEFVAPD